MVFISNWQWAQVLDKGKSIYNPYEYGIMHEYHGCTDKRQYYNEKELLLKQRYVPSMGELYFIYGTLRQGHRNHGLLIPDKFRILHQSAPISGYRFVEVYPGTPGAILNAGWVIHGDLYDMAPENIELMAIIEQGYTKIKVEVPIANISVVANMWIWQDNISDAAMLLPYSEWTLYIETDSFERGTL